MDLQDLLNKFSKNSNNNNSNNNSKIIKQLQKLIKFDSITSKLEENNKLLSNLILSEFSSLLETHPPEILNILNALILNIIEELNSTTNKTNQPSFHLILESILRVLKSFLADDERTGIAKNKIEVGKTCFKTLASLITVENIKPMIQRRVLDVFDYAISACVLNKGLLLQTSVFGPHSLANLIASSKDAGITERAIELAFRLGVEVVGVKAKGSAKKSKWENHLFPTKLYPLDRDVVLKDYRNMTVKNFDETLPILLDDLSTRNSSSFKLTFARTLQANGILLENNDGDISLPEITFGSNISINESSFTAVTTKLIDENEVDPEYSQLLLETDLSNIKEIEIETLDDYTVSINMRLFDPPDLDSVPLEETDGENEIRFEINSNDLINFKTTLSIRNINYNIKSSTVVQTSLPTPKITPRIRTQPIVQSPTKSITIADEHITPPRQIGSSNSKYNHQLPLPITAVEATNTTGSDLSSSTIIAGVKRSAVSELLPLSETKRVKGKIVTFSPVLDENADKSNVKGTSSDDIFNWSKGVSENTLKNVENDEINGSLSSVSSDSSEEIEDEILKKSLEKLPASAIRKIFASGFLETANVEMDVGSNDNDTLGLDESGKKNSETRLFGVKEVEKEILYSDQHSQRSIPKFLPRLNIIKPTPVASETATTAKKSKKKNINSPRVSSHQHRKSQTELVAHQDTRTDRQVNEDKELSDVLGVLSSIVLQKLALNSENAAQSFDNKVHALEYSARTLCQEFYDETEEIIIATNQALDFNQSRNKTINSLQKSAETSRKLISRLENAINQ